MRPIKSTTALATLARALGVPNLRPIVKELAGRLLPSEDARRYAKQMPFAERKSAQGTAAENRVRMVVSMSLQSNAFGFCQFK
jgi:hypothetical protein